MEPNRLEPVEGLLPNPAVAVFCAPKGEEVVPKEPKDEVFEVPPKPVFAEVPPKPVFVVVPPKVLAVFVAPKGEALPPAPKVLVFVLPKLVFEEPNVEVFDPKPPNAISPT